MKKKLILLLFLSLLLFTGCNRETPTTEKITEQSSVTEATESASTETENAEETEIAKSIPKITEQDTFDETTTEEKEIEELKLTVYQSPDTPGYDSLKVKANLGDTKTEYATKIRIKVSCDCKVALYEAEYDFNYNYLRKKSVIGEAEVKTGDCVAFICELAETIPYYCFSAETEDGQVCTWPVTMNGKDNLPYDVNKDEPELTEDDLMTKISGLVANYASKSDKDFTGNDDLYWTLINNVLTQVYYPELQPGEDETVEVSAYEIDSIGKALFPQIAERPELGKDFGIKYNKKSDTYTSQCSTLMYIPYEVVNLLINYDNTAQIVYSIPDTGKEVLVVLQWEPDTLFGWSVKDIIKY